jgi:hypothetical protein
VYLSIVRAIERRHEVKKEKERIHGSPQNNLWRLFRISVEKVKIPEETESKNLKSRQKCKKTMKKSYILLTPYSYGVKIN